MLSCTNRCCSSARPTLGNIRANGIAVIADWFGETPITAPSSLLVLLSTEQILHFMTSSDMKVKCNLLIGGLLVREKYGHCSHFHPHPASPKLWHRKPLHDRLVLLSFTNQLWPMEIVIQSSAAKCILAALLSARISRNTGGRCARMPVVQAWCLGSGREASERQENELQLLTPSSTCCLEKYCSH